MEILSLPTDYSLGRITLYLPGEREHPQILEARGSVRIPKVAKLFLDASQELCDDLSRILLIPRRLLENGIAFIEKDLVKADFRELRAIEPNCLVFSSCSGLRIGQFSQLGRSESLKHLNLSATPLDAQDYCWIRQFPNLKTLLLSGMGVDDECIAFLTDLQNLEDLSLTQSRISDKGAHTIWGFANLRRVSLRECDIGDRALEGVGSCSALLDLNVPGTRVSDIGVETVTNEVLQNCKNMASVSFRGCHITDHALVRLADLKSLRVVDVFRTNVTEEGLAYFKRTLPECIILAEREKLGPTR